MEGRATVEGGAETGRYRGGGEHSCNCETSDDGVTDAEKGEEDKEEELEDEKGSESVEKGASNAGQTDGTSGASKCIGPAGSGFGHGGTT